MPRVRRIFRLRLRRTPYSLPLRHYATTGTHLAPEGGNQEILKYYFRD